MRITFELYASLGAGRFGENVLELPSGSSVQQIMKETGIPEPFMGIMVVNGKHAQLDTILEDGDKIDLLPIVGGG